MIGLLLLAAFGHFVSSQTTYDCQCGFFVIEQAPGQIGGAAPIPFKANTEQVAPEACLEQTSGNNTCKWLCDEWGRSAVAEGWELCDAQAYNESVGIQRCYGGLYCEALFQDNRLPEEGGLSTSLRTWFRMPECAEASGYQAWNLGTYEYPEALCCTSLGNYDSCYDACDCIKADPLRYCECGVFASVQFQQGEETTDPLPFKMVSSTVGDTPFSFCDEYEANSPNEECEATCSDSGMTYFSNYSLTDSASSQYNVDPSVTFGQLYCNTLRTRRILYNQYINTEMRVFKRAPLCSFPPSEIAWLEMFPQVDHSERLCCTEDGEFEYPCYPPALDN